MVLIRERLFGKTKSKTPKSPLKKPLALSLCRYRWPLDSQPLCLSLSLVPNPVVTRTAWGGGGLSVGPRF